MPREAVNLAIEQSYRIAVDRYILSFPEGQRPSRSQIVNEALYQWLTLNGLVTQDTGGISAILDDQSMRFDFAGTKEQKRYQPPDQH